MYVGTVCASHIVPYFIYEASNYGNNVNSKREELNRDEIIFKKNLRLYRALFTYLPACARSQRSWVEMICVW